MYYMTGLTNYLSETLRWTKTPIDGPNPTPRLDHTICTVEIPKPMGTCTCDYRFNHIHTAISAF